MSGIGWNRKAFIFAAAALSGVSAVAASIAWAYPQPVASPVLGAEWQCQRALIVTTCTRVQPHDRCDCREVGPTSVSSISAIDSAPSRSQ